MSLLASLVGIALTWAAIALAGTPLPIARGVATLGEVADIPDAR